MSTERALAVFGAAPAFSQPVLVGQYNLPSWERLEKALRGIFERRFFANGGPLVRELDVAFPRALGIAHGVCVTNETVGMMIAAKALGRDGEVVVPAYAPPGTVQAISWAGLTPVLCDVDPHTFVLTAAAARRVLTRKTVAIVGVHLWGAPCDPNGLRNLAETHGLSLLFDAAAALGGTHEGRPFGSFGDAEVFSFHESQLLNAAEGGCIVTDDAQLASRLRTMRNFYVPAEIVPLRINGKMAEAPPALALLGLEDLPATVHANRARFAHYRTVLSSIPGIRLFEPGPDASCTDVVVEVDEAVTRLNRETLISALRAENVRAAAPRAAAVHHIPYYRHRVAAGAAFPVAERLARRALALPNGQDVNDSSLDRIGSLIRTIVARADDVRRALRDVP